MSSKLARSGRQGVAPKPSPSPPACNQNPALTVFHSSLCQRLAMQPNG
jgi:hypothetical protein